MKRIAIIDTGTNTFNLLIVEINEDRNINILVDEKIPVKLGEGGINKKFIAPPAFERGIKAIKDYLRVILFYHVDKTLAFGTSAIRSATNGKDFTEEVKRQTGLEIDVISGDKEAEYIYYGVREAVELGEEKVLILDVGGGSNEFIICNNKEKHSYDHGIARMLEMFNPSDPVTSEEIQKIESFLSTPLIPLYEACQKFNIRTLIGSSGSFETFAELIAHKFYKPDILNNKINFEIKIEEYRDIHRQLIVSTHDERLNSKAIITMRADMIVLASILVNFIVNRLGIQQMKLSTYALKEGVLFSGMT